MTGCVHAVPVSDRDVSKRNARKSRENEQPPHDVTGKWKREVLKLNERLGWPDKFIWDWFIQLAMCAEHETKIPRHEAERMGFRLLRGMFDKVNLGMDCN